MGNCSCFNSSEKGQVIFTQDNENENNQNPIPILRQQINVIPEETIFDIILNYYKSKNIEVKKIFFQQFSELITEETKKILDKYEDKMEESSSLINENLHMPPLKFAYKGKEKNENKSDFYYEGEFNKEGLINGKGTKIIPNDLIYKGNFLNEEYNGKGILIKKGASIFGQWIKGEIKGKVIYKVPDEFEYEGNFENFQKNGQGIEKYTDGSQYEGNFSNNKKNGFGVYKFANGEIYEGNFEDDLYEGEGRYVWGIGEKKYEGEFKKGEIEGKGVFTYEDGTVYNGYFENGLKNGEGFIEFLDGRKYYGNWINDELYGNGYLVSGNERTEVVFRHGKIISTIANTDEDNNNASFISNQEHPETFNNYNYIKFNIESFVGDKDKININKYICPLCNSFLAKPLKCIKCSNNFCKKCIKEKNICSNCNNDKFENNEELTQDMIENVKIKCDNCDKILDYQESLNHLH